MVLVRHDHEVAVSESFDVFLGVLRAEAEAQDLDDVLDLRRGTLVPGASAASRRMARPEPQGRRIRSVAVARLGPNGLKLEKETIHGIVRWTRVVSVK